MKVKSTLALTLSLLLTACGGGSDSNTSLSPTANIQASQPSTNNTPTANTNNTGGIGANLSAKKPDTASTPTTLNPLIQGTTAQVGTAISGIGNSTATLNINTVVIGNNNITLGSNLKSGTSLTNARYGYLTQRGTSPTLIAQGWTAIQVPTTGKATYRGSAVHVVAGNTPSSQVVSASFTADFDKKTLTGTIRTASPITLGATIAGNRFSGTVGDFSTSGYFYGAEAEELGGIYKNSDGTIGGAYGAKK